MPKIDVMGLPRKEFPIFLLIEKSTNSKNELQINNLVSSIAETLREIQYQTPDLDLKIGLYAFSKATDLFYPKKLYSLDEIDINDCLKEQSVDLSKVFEKLCHDLSRTTLLTSETGYVLPFVILVLAGDNNYTYADSLTILKENMWFKRARKIAFVVNDSTVANEMALDFTGTKEAIVKVDDIDTSISIFKQLITFVNCTGSILSERSITSDDAIVFVDPIEDDSEWDDEW